MELDVFWVIGRLGMEPQVVKAGQRGQVHKRARAEWDTDDRKVGEVREPTDCLRQEIACIWGRRVDL